MPRKPISAPRDPLIVQRQETPEGLLVHLQGDLSLASIPILWSNLKAALEDGHHVIVDLSGIERIEQNGITTLQEMHRLFLDAGQRFVVVAAPSTVRAWPRPSRQARAMRVFESTEAARHSLLADRSG